MSDPIYRDDVQCYVRELRYDFKTKTGTLMLEDLSSTDMRGCIGLFKKIDPDVVSIVTYSGGKRDTAYLLEGGEWKAHVATETRSKGAPLA